MADEARSLVRRKLESAGSSLTAGDRQTGIFGVCLRIFFFLPPCSCSLAWLLKKMGTKKGSSLLESFLAVVID